MAEFKDYYGTHMKFNEYPSFGILSGLKVVMTGSNIAGPYGTCILAEMGAKVVQVESPTMPCQNRGGYHYMTDHRNTFSITLNTRSKRGRQALDKLLAWADVWVESGRPGTYAKMGLTDKAAWKINPALGIVHVSGFGQYGPYKDKAAYDVSGQAMGGYMYMNGASPTSAPTKVSPYTADYVTALQVAICAASLAYHGKVTGQGDSVDISQYESMFRLLGPYITDWYNRGYPADGQPVKWRTGNKSDICAGFSFYDCKDGNSIFIGMVGKGNVEKGLPLVGLPKVGTDPDFPVGMTGAMLNIPAGQRVEAAIEKFCAEHTADEVAAIMDKAGIPCQKAYGPADIENDPHYAAREDLITWTDSAFGEVKGPGIMNKFSRNPAKVVSAAPLFGEHSREILTELGFDEATIDKMYASGETVTWDARDTAVAMRYKEWRWFWNDEQAEKVGL